MVVSARSPPGQPPASGRPPVGGGDGRRGVQSRPAPAQPPAPVEEPRWGGVHLLFFFDGTPVLTSDDFFLELIYLLEC